MTGILRLQVVGDLHSVLTSNFNWFVYTSDRPEAYPDSYVCDSEVIRNWINSNSKGAQTVGQTLKLSPTSTTSSMVAEMSQMTQRLKLKPGSQSRSNFKGKNIELKPGDGSWD